MKPERVKREAERLKQGPNSNENPCDIITVRFIVRCPLGLIKFWRMRKASLKLSLPGLSEIGLEALNGDDCYPSGSLPHARLHRAKMTPNFG